MTQLNNSTTGTPPPVETSNCLADHWNDALGECVFPAAVGAVGGEAMLGLLVGVTVVGGTALSGGNTATPAALLLVVGSVLVGMLPASYHGLAYAFVIVGLAAAVYKLAEVLL
jgi:hypothetical protein